MATRPISGQSRHTILMVADIGPDDVVAFSEYEDAVLALMPEYSGCVERRLRSADGTVEAQIISFPDRDSFAAFADSPERLRARRSLTDRTIYQRIEVLHDVD